MSKVIEASGLNKHYGRVVALEDCEFDLNKGEILSVIGDNGAGKSTLIKVLSGAVKLDSGEVRVDEKLVNIESPQAARQLGIETVFQNLALAPSLSISDNMFMGREIRLPGIVGRYLRVLDRKKMEGQAREHLSDLGLMTVQNIRQSVETLSGGQRQGVAVARAAAFGSRVLILDEPTAALGVKESSKVIDLILRLKESGMSIVLVSHNMPQVFEVSDRIHVHRLGSRTRVLMRDECTMSDAVAYMTGAK